MSNKNPFFSIIMPSFNSEKVIRGAIDSIRAQTFQFWELVIFDGGSQDNTLAIIDSYRESRIKIICGNDKGLYDAMNKATSFTKGTWYYFLGSDDQLFDDKVLESVRSSLRSREARTIIYGNVEVIGDTQWARDGEFYGGRFTFGKLSRKNICHQAAFYNSKMLRKYKLEFNLRYPVSADWDFNIRCWMLGRPCYVPMVIAKFHSGGFSTAVTTQEPFHHERHRYFTWYNRIIYGIRDKYLF